MTLEYTSPLFKGATRPACFFGVPLKPFLGVALGFALLGLWTEPPAALLAIPVILAMRSMTKNDDQRFRQLAVSFETRTARVRAGRSLLRHYAAAASGREAA